MAASRRLTDVQYALKAKALAQLAREIGIAEALAVISAAKAENETATPRESAAAACRSKRDEMVAELIHQEREGHRRGAVRRVARDFALDRRDPIEVESNARNLRRWRKKIPDSVRLSSPKSIRG
jgi:hypothetical protein